MQRSLKIETNAQKEKERRPAGRIYSPMYTVSQSMVILESQERVRMRQPLKLLQAKKKTS